MSATTERTRTDASRPAAGAAPSGRRRRRLLRRLVATPAGVLGLALTLTVVLVALLADVIAPGDPFASAGPALRPPSTEHLMGTDNLGRDVFRAVVHGARTSMTVVVGVLLISSAIGIVVGAVAGYRGGLVDDVLMRITEVFQSLPHFFLALLVVALFGSSLRNLVVFLGLTSWELLARVVRAETLSIRQQAFVEAAQAAGATDRRILFRHVVPNSLPSATVVMALVGSTVILIEAGLSFIGLGDQTQMSWGFLINNAETFLQVAWWMSVFPGLSIVIAVLGLNLLSDGLNDALNPSPDSSRRLRPRGKLRARLAARRDPPATRAGRRRRVPA